jgi:hypothetical protein
MCRIVKMSRIQFQAGMSLNQFLASYGTEQQCKHCCFEKTGEWDLLAPVTVREHWQGKYLQKNTGYYDNEP